MPESQAKSLYPHVPAVFIGCLAVCKAFQGNQLGVQLVVSALRKGIAMHDKLGLNPVVVDPLGEDVVGFYKKFGFQEFGQDRLFLPINTAKQALHLVAT